MNLKSPQAQRRTLNGCFCLALMLGLAGCATVRDCDPLHDPGFFGSINRHGSDCYAKRVGMQKQSMAQAEMDRQSILEELRGTQATSAELDAQIQQAETDLEDMTRQLKTLQNKLKTKSNSNATLAARVYSLQNRIGALKAEVKAKKNSPKKQEFDKVRDKLKQEQKELEILKRDLGS